jgi:hypothetical protein
MDYLYQYQRKYNHNEKAFFLEGVVKPCIIAIDSTFLIVYKSHVRHTHHPSMEE